MAWAKYKYGSKEQNPAKKMPIKYACSIIASKRPIIIRILSSLVVYQTTIIF